jgi:UDP-N-acetylmuramate dehydrogenase
MSILPQIHQGSVEQISRPGLIQKNIMLDLFTSLKIGGVAKYFAEPRSIAELQEAVAFALRRKLPWMILGNGTNLLVPDEGVRGLVIRLGRKFGAFDLTKNTLHAQAGAGLGAIMGYLRARGYHDFDGLVGIPGTIGGALTMNAGIPEFSISEITESVLVLNRDGNLRKLNNLECGFSYRTSEFQTRDEIIVGAEFKLGLEERFNPVELLQRRRERQPLRWPSAGCIFKNPVGIRGAGELIDSAGLKGISAGGAMISPKHGNFIVNRGDASAKDVHQLIDFAVERVYKEFEVELQLEVAVVSNRSLR